MVREPPIDARVTRRLRCALPVHYTGSPGRREALRETAATQRPDGRRAVGPDEAPSPAMNPAVRHRPRGRLALGGPLIHGDRGWVGLTIHTLPARRPNHGRRPPVTDFERAGRRR